MPKQTKKTTSGDNLPQKKKSNLSLKDKMRKHIHDINDVISDEDIRDADISGTALKNEVDQKEAELLKNSEKNEGNAREGGKKSITPWDTLDE